MVGEFSNPPSCAPNPKHSPLYIGSKEDHIHFDFVRRITSTHPFSWVSAPILTFLLRPTSIFFVGGFDNSPDWEKVDGPILSVGFLTVAWFCFLQYMSCSFSVIVCALVFHDVYFWFEWNSVWTMRQRISFYRYIWLCLYDLCSILYVGLFLTWRASIWFVVGAAACGKVK